MLARLTFLLQREYWDAQLGDDSRDNGNIQNKSLIKEKPPSEEEIFLAVQSYCSVSQEVLITVTLIVRNPPNIRPISK